MRPRELDGPGWLRTFVAGDWPGVDDAERFAAWKAARRQWAGEHGAVLDPIEEAAQTPDEPLDPYSLGVGRA